MTASVMLLLILVTVIVPIALLAEATAEHLPALFSALRDWRAADLQVPEQIKSIPIVGESVFQWLASLLADRTQSAALLQRALEPAGKLSLAFVRILGDGLLQLLLVAFIVFFYYRDGERIAQLTHRISRRLSGEMSDEVLSIVVGTTRSVFISIVGTAAAQAIVAYVGFSDRGRARRVPVGRRHVRAVGRSDGSGGAVGRSRDLAVHAGRAGLGHLHGHLGQPPSSAASTIF